MTRDDRTVAAESLLGEHGLRAEVAAEGPDGEIAAIRTGAPAWERMMEGESAALVAAIRALGFRYVALDLRAADP